MNRQQGYHSPELAARALGGLLRSASSTSVDSAAKPDREQERLLAALAVIDARVATRGRWARPLMLAAMALALGGFGWLRLSTAPLTFVVDGMPQMDGATIAAGANRTKNVRFSDGSTIAVRSGAHLRVESSSATGSRLALVDGEANVHVLHREQAAWTLDAGPFEIHVIGTRFNTDWDPVRSRLSIELFEGSVQVTGGQLSTPVRMHAGQRLDAGGSLDNWRLTSLNRTSSDAAPAPSGSLPSSAAESAAPGDAERSVPPAASAQAPAPASDWSVLVERADFDGIVREANTLGIEHCLLACSPRNLRILADAARYSGRTALAERSLLSLRKRAPAEAMTAAFLLARLDEERGRPESALTWYERYLKEAPSGPYAAEALGGKMRMLLLTGASDDARSTAEVYLKRFPGGVAAASAAKILANVHNP